MITNVTTPAPCTTDSPCPTIFDDIGQVDAARAVKDIGATAPLSPTTNNEVTITRYHVDYRRADGRNTPGVDVPFAFDGAVTGTIPAGGTLTSASSSSATSPSRKSPLVQLRTSPNIISTIADVTFYGTDRVGNDVQRHRADARSTSATLGISRTMAFTYIRRAAVALALIATAGCTVHSTEAPPLTGPSGLALIAHRQRHPRRHQPGRRLAVVDQGHGDRSRRHGRCPGVPLRLDMVVGGVAQDYGTLSARSIVTDSDGVATAVYTAPPSPASGVFGTCAGLPGNCVTIVATPTGTEFRRPRIPNW